MDNTTNFKDCYNYSDVCARIINYADSDVVVEMKTAENIYCGANNFVIRKVYDFGEIGTWIANACSSADTSHYCFDKEAQEWLTKNEDWWTGKMKQEREKKNISNSHKTAHTNYSIDHIIERLKISPSFTTETVDYLYRLKDKGYSLVCWSTINGWVAINYDVAEDNAHADIKRFSCYHASILEENYNKGYLDE